MSIESEKRGLDFVRWKRDLDERLHKWLNDHPETKVTSLAGVSSKNGAISIRESLVHKGGWTVLKDDRILLTFYGANALQDAVRFANDYANSDRPNDLLGEGTKG